MWKLIVSEWKKIFRSRLNIFLLLFLIGYTLFSMCSYTFGPISYEEDLQFATFAGEPLQTYAKLYAYADQVLAQYEGEVDEALIEEILTQCHDGMRWDILDNGHRAPGSADRRNDAGFL